MLRYLAGQASPVAATAIARDLRLPRSTTYHLLDTLTQEGFVSHLAEQRRYGLGLAAYELGTGYTRQAPLQRLARMPLMTLVDRTGHSGHLAVLHGREVVYVLEERARGRAPLITDVGVRLPAQLTATGRAILAALPAAHVRALFSAPDAFVLRNDVGPASISGLRSLLTATRKRQYAEETDSVTPGFSSVGLAVLDHNRYPVAAVALTFRTDEVAPDARRPLAERIARTAREIGIRLGGSTA